MAIISNSPHLGQSSNSPHPTVWSPKDVDIKGHSLSLPRQMTHPKPLELKMPGLRGEPSAGEGGEQGGMCGGVGCWCWQGLIFYAPLWFRLKLRVRRRSPVPMTVTVLLWRPPRRLDCSLPGHPRILHLANHQAPGATKST